MKNDNNHLAMEGNKKVLIIIANLAIMIMVDNKPNLITERMQNKKSDADILVEINDDSIGLLSFITLKNLIEKALKKKIDLVEYETIRKELRSSILRD